MVITVILGSCSPKLSKNLLSFFFDGVPVSDSINTDTTTVFKNVSEISDTVKTTAIIENRDFIVHYPYREKECYSCHDENSKSEFVLPQPDLCYICHDDFSTVLNTYMDPF